jgi:hypothetical protein
MSRINILKYCIARAKAERKAADCAIDPRIAETHRAMATCFNALILEVAPLNSVTRQ